ncbi:MAG: S41 family peptidase [Bacteroidales bacterium]|jgi:hypothetical protein
MMPQIKYIFIILILSACERIFIEKDPGNTPGSNFDIFWNTFDRHYALFSIKKINWDSLYTVYRPQVSQNSTPGQLLEVLFNMTLELEDSHVCIYPDFGGAYSFDRREGYPENSYEHAANYLSDTKTLNTFFYGDINFTDLGYIRITDFEGDVNYFNPYENDAFEKIDEVLSDFRDKGGVVIDVRSNHGGSDFMSKIVAARFADRKQVFSYMYWRNGEEHDDFISTERYIEPKGEFIFTKPVAILMNRDTYSAAEGFIDMMKLLPRVTLFGGSTGGGTGGGSYFELPNGWTYRVTTSYSTDAGGYCYEGVGITPDIEVTISEEDKANGIDTILEEAVRYLSENK